MQHFWSLLTRKERNVSTKTKYVSVILFLMMCELASMRIVLAQSARVNSTAAVLADFTKRVNDYVALHKRLADRFGQIDETKSQAEIAKREKTLGDAIRAARADAKPGDILTRRAAAIFKRLIAEEYQRRPRATVKVREDPREAESADFRPVLNQTYPSAEPLETFPAGLLRVLPQLPKEIEYRIVGRYLVLRDTGANVIVDCAREMIPGEHT
jgi:hypothetical protein